MPLLLKAHEARSAQPPDATRAAASVLDLENLTITSPARRLPILGTELFNCPWFLTRRAHSQLVAQWRMATADTAEDDRPDPGRQLADRLRAAGIKVNYYDPEDDDDDNGDDEKEYPVTDDNIACIPIAGPLTKASYWRSMSYADIQRKCSDALNDDNIKAVMLAFDSPGGEAGGMFDVSDYLYNERGKKPMVAISDDQCFSAAYCLASAADKIFVTRMGGTGSIGCWTAHVDMSKMLAKAGVNITYIFSGDKKVDGNPHEPLSDRALNDMQEEVDRVRDMFVGAVARNRGVAADSLYKTEAGIYFAQNGIPLLADYLGTPADALAYLRGQIASTSEEETPATEKTDGKIGAITISSGIITAALTLPPSLLNTFGQATAMVHAGPIAPHKTATSDKSWDGPANEARLKNDQNAAYYSKAYAWREGGGDGTKKNQFRFIHHEVSSGGDIGAANITACRAGIAVLNGARGGTTIPAADKKGVYNHLAKHLRDAGVEPPTLKSEAEMPWIVRLGVEHLLDPRWADRQALLALADRFQREYVQIESSVYGDTDIPLDIQIEARLLTHPDLKAEAEQPGGSSRKITMLAVPYETLSVNMGGFREVYQRGCFAQGLVNDPRCLFNHDESRVLGRQSAGTAKFWESSAGVHIECEAPATSWADDLLVSMRRGDITQASAAFWILQQRWEIRGSDKVRVVEKALFREGSVHAFAAYELTQANAAPATTEQASATAAHKGLHLLRARLELMKRR